MEESDRSRAAIVPRTRHNSVPSLSARSVVSASTERNVIPGGCSSSSSFSAVAPRCGSDTGSACSASSNYASRGRGGGGADAGRRVGRFIRPDATVLSSSEDESSDDESQDETILRPQPPSVNIVMSSEALMYSSSAPSSPSRFECAICLDLLCEPLRLPCSHAFCRACITASCRSRRSCPLCRAQLPSSFTPSVVAVDKDLEKQLLLAFPVAYEKKLIQTLEEENFQRSSRGRVASRVRFGNRYEPVPNGRLTRNGQHQNKHRWALFVELDKIPEYLVRSVTFKLRPYFKEDVIRTTAPYEVSRLGWGEFPVEITVTWKSDVRRPPLVLEHDLCFVAGGSSSSVEVDLGDALHREPPFHPVPRRPSTSSVANAPAPSRSSTPSAAAPGQRRSAVPPSRRLTRQRSAPHIFEERPRWR